MTRKRRDDGQGEIVAPAPPARDVPDDPREAALDEAGRIVGAARTVRERIAALRRAAAVLSRLEAGIASYETSKQAAACTVEAEALADRVGRGEVDLDDEAPVA